MQLYGLHPSGEGGERYRVPNVSWRRLWSLASQVSPGAVPAEVHACLARREEVSLNWAACRRLALGLRRIHPHGLPADVRADQVDRLAGFLEQCGGFAYRPIMTPGAFNAVQSSTSIKS